jgi:hypothetical protein
LATATAFRLKPEATGHLRVWRRVALNRVLSEWLPPSDLFDLRGFPLQPEGSVKRANLFDSRSLPAQAGSHES